MSDRTEQRSAVARLCTQALAESIELSDLWRSWSAEYNREPFLRQVYEDLEDWLEHRPRDGVSTVPTNLVEPELTRLAIDAALLETDATFNEMERYRGELLQRRVAREHVQIAVRQLVEHS